VGAAVDEAEGGVVNEHDRLRANLYCCAEVIRSRQRAGQPIPEWLRRHHAKLDSEFQTSALRHETGCASTKDGQLAHVDWMGNADVARYLNLSTRQVQRLRKAGELGGVQVSGGWIFSRTTVIEFAERRADG
jgi:hypothetical protein